MRRSIFLISAELFSHHVCVNECERGEKGLILCSHVSFGKFPTDQASCSFARHCVAGIFWDHTHEMTTFYSSLKKYSTDTRKKCAKLLCNSRNQMCLFVQFLLLSNAKILKKNQMTQEILFCFCSTQFCVWRGRKLQR